MKTEMKVHVAHKNKSSYPVTELARTKPVRSYDEGDPYGDFKSEKSLIQYLESLDDKTFKKVSDLYKVMVEDKGG